jgi:hypothetical protein
MKRKIVKILTIFAIISLICGVVFWLLSIQVGWLRFDYRDVQIADFAICTEYDNELEEATYTITNENEIYACGVLTTTSPIEFGIYVYHDLIKYPILVVNAYNVEEGFFAKRIHLPDGSPSGEYRVDIRFRRNVIATTNFELEKP